MSTVSWPEVGLELIGELRAHPGRLALAPAGRGLDDGLEAIAALLESAVTSVGLTLTTGRQPTSVEEIESRLAGESVLTDLDILFWPPLIDIDVLRLLTGLARHRPIVAAWPGRIDQARAIHSIPGRRDYFEAKLADVVVLRGRPRHFPDQTPFVMEHIPA
jgi:hypothetical protein